MTVVSDNRMLTPARETLRLARIGQIRSFTFAARGGALHPTGVVRGPPRGRRCFFTHYPHQRTRRGNPKKL